MGGTPSSGTDEVKLCPQVSKRFRTGQAQALTPSRSACTIGCNRLHARRPRMTAPVRRRTVLFAGGAALAGGSLLGGGTAPAAAALAPEPSADAQIAAILGRI